MLFYRFILITLASMAITHPVFATNPTSMKAESNHAASVTAPKTVNQQGVQSNKVKININQATEKELIKVRGLNASKAKAIVKYRKQHGDFKELDTLANVRGFIRMKEEDLKNIKDQLSIN